LRRINAVAGRVGDGQVAAGTIGIDEAERVQGRTIGRNLHVTQVHPHLRHVFEEPAA
jgi:hypothetical protein